MRLIKSADEIQNVAAGQYADSCQYDLRRHLTR